MGRKRSGTAASVEAVAGVPPSVPSVALPAGGVSTTQAGFMDGADGRPSLSWTNYKGAHFTTGYGPFFGTPGNEIARERSLAASISTDFLTSNPQIATLVENFAVQSVGTGLTLSSRPDAKALGISPEAARDLSDMIETCWQAWAANPVECDASSRHNVHQMAVASFKSFLLTGEALFVLDWLKGNGARSSTKVRLLDPRQLDQSVTRVEERGNILQGIQFDQAGRVVGYWIRPFVLGNIASAPQPVFVRARTSWGRERTVHLFDLLIPGQVRGMSPLTAALSSARSKGMLREYTLGQAMAQAMVAITIKSDLPAAQALNSLTGDAPFGQQQLSPEAWVKSRGDYYSAAKIELSPAKVAHLHAGDELEMHRAQGPNQTYEPFDESMGRDIAKAAGSSVEDMTGNYSKTSFAASRLAMDLPFRINKRRRAAITERFYGSVFRAWLEEACETGRIVLPPGAPAFWEQPDAYSKCAWHGEGPAVADKLKNAQADLLEINNGLATRESKLAERGIDLETFIRQCKAEQGMLEAAGLQYATPRPQNVDAADRDDEALQ